MLNSFLNFNDLWNTVGYEYVFTTFSILAPDEFWMARKSYVDNETNLPPERRYQSDLEVNMRIVHALAVPPAESFWPEFRRTIEVAIPSEVRPSLIAAICENSPYYVDRLNTQERANRQNIIDRTMRTIRESGASSVEVCGSFNTADYIDRTHLSVDGAAKIGKPLADAVRALALRRGWR
jgi:hypothetical protein